MFTIRPADRQGAARSSRHILAMSLMGAAVALSVALPCHADPARANLQFSVIPPSVRGAIPAAQTDSTTVIHFDLALMPRNKSAMDQLALSVSDPSSSHYGEYLTPEEFKATFGPTDEQVAKVKLFAVANGFVVDSVAKNNMLMRLHGTVAQINKAFGIALNDYWDPVEKRTYHAPDAEPTVDSSVAPLIRDIIGLSDKAVLHPMMSKSLQLTKPRTTKIPGQKLIKTLDGSQIYYSGHDGLAPSDTTSIYNVNYPHDYGYNGSGQVLGLYEVGTYLQSNISTWESYYGITHVPQTLIGVDGYNTSSSVNPPGGASPEVVLDIDMLEIMASGASGLRIYENSGFSSQSLQDSFSDMANDSPLADVISISYGTSELDQSASDLDNEYDDLATLDIQGQSVFCASGDSGAWTDQGYPKTDPNVSDPGGEPLLVSVGGTNLTDSSTYGYVSETSWFDPNDTGRGPYGTGGGGGVSQFWGLPFYQSGAFNTSVNPQGSTTNRNDPDVSFCGDYDTEGFDIYITTGGGGGWGGYNGTSAASPLWAGFMAVANQEREANGQPLIGFADPAIYAAAEGPLYGSAFHDINDGSTNGVYKTVPAYDNSTGWGSFNGANILVLLAGVFVNSGASGTENGTILNPWPTVEDGVSSAGLSPTTPIEITAGSYGENITISNPVTLSVYGSGTVTIGT